MKRSTWRRIAAYVGGALAVLILLVVIYAVNVLIGMHVEASTSATIDGLALQAPVQIVRDARGIPHIRAQNEHDLFFAQGYVEGGDRLFQLDLLRRYVTGTLAEVLGSPVLATDERARNVPIQRIVAAQWQHLAPHDRAILQAYSDGVNAAMKREPAPVEFRILLYYPKPWTPQDSLAVSMVTLLDLTDTWDDIAPRDAAYRKGIYDLAFPLTDPCYDAPVLSGLGHILTAPTCYATILRGLSDRRPPIGSNGWAIGAAHSVTGRALLANDPHLSLQIPGVWYLIDLGAPGFHVAGATLPGTPGVTIGHNERIAWGVTSGTVAAMSVFDGAAPRANEDDETFHVRFGADVHKQYYRGTRDFGVHVHHGRFVFVRWYAYEHPRSPLEAFDALDRAQSSTAAIAALRTLPGPGLNFVIADADGTAAYQLAGTIPNDPAWARYIHPASDRSKTYPDVPFTQLPAVAPSRNAIVWTANNKMYGASYPLRLSPTFAPPYRAYRIAQLLKARATYDVAYFATMQMDNLSLPEFKLAKFLGWQVWDGHVAPASTQATFAIEERKEIVAAYHGIVPAMIDLRKGRDELHRTYNVLGIMTPVPWLKAGAVQVYHPLAALGIHFLDGTLLPGNGDAYTLHVQSPGFSQSFRSVWDVGNWGAGGMSIPQGESGEPGSGHYTDAAIDWVAGRLIPLPFGTAAIERAAVTREWLRP